MDSEKMDEILRKIDAAVGPPESESESERKARLDWQSRRKQALKKAS